MPRPEYVSESLIRDTRPRSGWILDKSRRLRRNRHHPSRPLSRQSLERPVQVLQPDRLIGLRVDENCHYRARPAERHAELVHPHRYRPQRRCVLPPSEPKVDRPACSRSSGPARCSRRCPHTRRTATAWSGDGSGVSTSPSRSRPARVRETRRAPPVALPGTSGRPMGPMRGRRRTSQSRRPRRHLLRPWLFASTTTPTLRSGMNDKWAANPRNPPFRRRTVASA